MDVQELTKPESLQEQLDSLLYSSGHMFNIFLELEDQLRKLVGVKTEKYRSQFQTLDEVIEVSKRLNGMQNRSARGMSTNDGIELLANLHRTSKKGITVLLQLSAEPEIVGNDKEILAQVHDRQLGITSFLNFLEERLDQMKPKSRDNIEDLIKYVEKYQKEAITA